jgi:uncharacterized phage-associated protein
MIYFKPKPEKIIETLLYLTPHVPTDELNQCKCAKLIYLADIKHLNEFGRPITFDQMVATEYGPVPSVALSILKLDEATARRYELNYDDLPFKITKEDEEVALEPTREIDRMIFSKSDTRILDEVIEEFGARSFADLYGLTCGHVAYENAWDSRGTSSQYPMKIEDMIEDSPQKEDLIEYLRDIAPTIA